MLTPGEIDYLRKIPTNKVVKIYSYDPKVAVAAEGIINSIHKIYPNLVVKHMGASALKISGQNDLDIYTFSDPKDFDKFLPGLIKLFGKPLHKHDTFIEWEFKKNGFDIQFYLTLPPKNHIAIFEKLKNNPDLLKVYEDLKESMNGKSFRQYQEEKYEFYHLILAHGKTKKALDFLIDSIKTSGHNPKPVIFHSIKVALLLSKLGSDEDVLVASLLHDLIEDTDVTYKKLVKEFDKNTGDLVRVLSFNKNINNRNTRDKDEVNKVVKSGHNAVVIKASDFIDNSYFYYLADKKLQTYLVEKYRYFLVKSKPIIANEKIYKMLRARFKELTK